MSARPLSPIDRCSAQEARDILAHELRARGLTWGDGSRVGHVKRDPTSTEDPLVLPDPRAFLTDYRRRGGAA